MHFKGVTSTWMIPSNRVLSVTKKTEADKRVNATDSLLLLKDRAILQSSDGIFRSIYFSRSTENDPFVQSITNDDVLANNIIRRVSTNFSGSSLQATYGRPSVGSSDLKSVQSTFQQRSAFLASSNELLNCCREFSFWYNGLRYCRACVRSEAYTVLFARKGRHISHDTSWTYSQSLQFF